jgi:outer membrane protein assembly factor BamB
MIKFLHCGRSLLSVFLFLGAASAPVRGGDWPSFRGPDRSAVSKETGLLKEWPAQGPPLVWQTKGAGRGYASLAIDADRIYTLGDAPSTASDDEEYLLCFSRSDGKPLWKTKTGRPLKMPQESWGSSRSTPTVDGELVYVISPHADLVCCESKTGKERWRKNLKGDFDGKKPGKDKWGYSESVLIDGDRLMCTPGGEQATMVALDKVTGDLKWKAVHEGNRGAGHSSIVISEIGGTKVYVQLTGSGPIGVRASDGEVLWSYPIEDATAIIPTPVVRGDLVFFTAAYRCGGALLRQVAGANGTVTIEEVYPLNLEMQNKHGGVVLVGDYLYGDFDDKGTPWCAELLSGEMKWKKRSGGKNSASVVTADGMLYFHFADGTMVLAKADPQEYLEVSRFTVPGSGDRPSWSHPVILDRRLYVREQDHISCFDIRAK